MSPEYIRLRYGVTVAKRGDEWEWSIGRSGFRSAEEAAQSFAVWRQGVENEGAQEQKRRARETLRDLVGL